MPFGSDNLDPTKWMQKLHDFLYQGTESAALMCKDILLNAFDAGSFTGDAQNWWISLVGGRVDVVVDGAKDLGYTVEYPGMLNVMVAVMIPVLGIFLAFQVLMSLIRSSTAGMLRAFGASILAIPATYTLAGLVFVGLRGTDQAAKWILKTGTTSSDGKKTDIAIQGLLNLFGLTWSPDAHGGKGGVMLDANFQVWSMAGDENNPGYVIIPLIVVIVVWLMCLVLMIMMIARTVFVLVLAMFTPVAVFSVSLDAAKSIMGKWLSIIVGLMLAKPVAAAIVSFGVTMASYGKNWSQGCWVQVCCGAVLVLISAAMPVLMLTIVSFMTPGGHHQLEQATVAGGMAAGRAGQRAMHAAGGGARAAGRAGKAAGGAAKAGGRAAARAAPVAGAAAVGAGRAAGGAAKAGYKGAKTAGRGMARAGSAVASAGRNLRGGGAVGAANSLKSGGGSGGKSGGGKSGGAGSGSGGGRPGRAHGSGSSGSTRKGGR